MKYLVSSTENFFADLVPSLKENKKTKNKKQPKKQINTLKYHLIIKENNRKICYNTPVSHS